MSVQSTAPGMAGIATADKLLKIAFSTSEEVEDVDVIVPMTGAIWVYVKFKGEYLMQKHKEILQRINRAANSIKPPGTRLVVSPVK